MCKLIDPDGNADKGEILEMALGVIDLLDLAFFRRRNVVK